MGIVEELKTIPDIHFKENEDMSLKTSLKVGGKAKYFVEPESVRGLAEAVKIAKTKGVEYKIVGNGTNLLISDKGFNGLVACTKNLNRVLLDKGEIIALCGTPLSRLVRFTQGSGRVGAEGLADIPATVGGAICRNAGAFGYAVSDYITEVTSVKDGEVIRRKKGECRFSYRKSIFLGNGEFIASAKFHFPKRRDAVKTDFKEQRRKMQPLGRTCGSVFVNPPDVYAGKLIEDAGLKGLTIGGATVSDKHANFIVTTDGATANDVYGLINEIKKEVFAKFGVKLAEEVEYVGEFNAT